MTRITNTTYSYVINNSHLIELIIEEQLLILLAVILGLILVLVLLLLWTISAAKYYKGSYVELSKRHDEVVNLLTEYNDSNTGWKDEAYFWRNHFDSKSQN